jgi:rod shape-determining protein MreD
VKIAASLAAIAIALALQTTLGSLVIRGTAALDLVLIVVVYIAIMTGPVTGLLLGCVAGLIQDGLSSGIIGIGGLAKTVVGFVAGFLGTQFIVVAPLARFVVFMLATALHAAVFMGLYVLLDIRQFESPWGPVMSQALGNALVGVVGAQIVELLPGLRDRRKARRASRLPR